MKFKSRVSAIVTLAIAFAAPFAGASEIAHPEDPVPAVRQAPSFEVTSINRDWPTVAKNQDRAPRLWR
jgi:hypothetical protein